MLMLKNVSVARGGQTLISNITFSAFAKNIIGIIGANGCGKTTLFSIIQGGLEASDGSIEINKNCRLKVIEQETPAIDITAVSYVISGDNKLFQVLNKLELAEQNDDHKTILECHQYLGETDGYSAEAKAAKILAGLGFSHQEIMLPVKNFSGGWRMRLNLAKCLFAPSDILLLDEPTNHLDMETIIWLEDFLKTYPGLILLVSHDRDFLDRTVTHIAHIENNHLKMYTGNFSTFEIERANAILIQKAQYRTQQAKIEHLMHFVDRFRAKATKAKQAQSRLKAIERMELVKPVYEKLPFNFCFKEPKSMPNPMLSMRHAVLGYGEHSVLHKVNIGIMAGQRIGLLGVNGAGKSTFIKSMCRNIPPLKGTIECSPGTNIGYFAQHQVDYLDGELSPFALLKDIAKDCSEKELISYLAQYNFNRDKSLTPVKFFSGGEKARVAFALIIWQRPNLLLLDEPTNHLDLEMRQALTLALEDYQGTLILVSHDRYLLRSLVNELFLIENGTVTSYDGTVEDYQTLYK